VPALRQLLAPFGRRAPGALLALTERVEEGLGAGRRAGSAQLVAAARMRPAGDPAPPVEITQVLPGGVRAVATGSNAPDGFDLTLELSKRGYAVEAHVENRDTRRSLDQCPSAEGVVHGSSSSRLRITTIVRKGRRVLAPVTAIFETSQRVRGQVDDDARLRSFELDVTHKISQARRASQWSAQIDQHATVDVALARAGSTGAYSDYTAAASADLRWLALYASGSEIAAAERELAAELLKSYGRDFLAIFVQSWLEDLTEAEQGWNEADRCVEISFSPEPGTRRVAVGERGSFTGHVQTKAGAPTRARWSARAGWPVIGRVEPLATTSAPGAPASFSYTGEDGPGEDSVSVNFRVTTPAGVALRGWSALKRQEVPKAWMGTISGRFEDPDGDVWTWNANVTFTLSDDEPRFTYYPSGTLNCRNGSFSLTRQAGKFWLKTWGPDQTLYWAGGQTSPALQCETGGESRWLLVASNAFGTDVRAAPSARTLTGSLSDHRTFGKSDWSWELTASG
jgi:hypothetical protein